MTSRQFAFSAIACTVIAAAGCTGSPNVILPAGPPSHLYVTNAPLVAPFCHARKPLSRHVRAAAHHAIFPFDRKPSAACLQNTTRRLADLNASEIMAFTQPIQLNASASLTLAPDPANFDGQGIAFDSMGRLFVVDHNQTKIFIFNTPLTSSSVAAITIDISAFASAPIGVAFDPKGNLWVADNDFPQAVYEFKPPFLTSAPSVPDLTLTDTVNFSEPIGIRFDRAGDLAVADSNQVEIYSPPFFTGDNVPTAVISVTGARGVAFDVASRLFVTTEAGPIRVFNPPFGSSGNVPAFSIPSVDTSIGLEDNGLLLVFDQFGNLFVPYSFDGNTDLLQGQLSVFSPPFSSASAPIFSLTSSNGIHLPVGVGFGP